MLETWLNLLYIKRGILQYMRKGEEGMETEMQEKKKRGYLRESFRLFHLHDQVTLDINPHYHEFDKIIIFLSGKVTYIIEGKSYYLKPWDILFVSHHDIHKPVIDTEMPYERIVIWLKEEFLERDRDTLSECFRLTHERHFSLLRLEPVMRGKVQNCLLLLEEELNTVRYGSGIMAESYLRQLLVLFCRLIIENPVTCQDISYACDDQIVKMLAYINENLEKDLTVEALAGRLYLSSSHLMHKFKQETGYSIHKYIKAKRLMLAADLIKSGTPAMAAGLKCGFKEYSAFSRAFYQMYGVSPGKFV